jgi:spore coat protein U domain-containing protein, fimbrial subunit CupE1/2/3/6
MWSAPRSLRSRACTLGPASLLWLLVAGPAFGDASCTTQAAGVAFGTYDILATTPTDAVGSVTITCSYIPSPGGAPVIVSVMLGAGSSGALPVRRMFSPTDTMDYNLYLDATHTQIWGDGTAGTGFPTARIRVGPGVGNATRFEEFSIYGRIPAQQSVDSGSYTDTIVVTVEF